MMYLFTLKSFIQLAVRANARPPLCLVRPSVDSLSRVLTVLRKLIPPLDSNYISIKRDSNYIGSGTIHRKGQEDDEAENAE